MRTDLFLLALLCGLALHGSACSHLLNPKATPQISGSDKVSSGRNPTLQAKQEASASNTQSAAKRYEEATIMLQDALYPEASKAFQDIKNTFPYSRYGTLAQLRLADSMAQKGDLIEAIAAYQTFLSMHPQHSDNGYVTFQIAWCHYQQIADPIWFLPPIWEKDPSTLRLAAAAFEDMLRQYPEHFLSSKAQKLLLECRQRLAAHELYVGRFYFKRQRYQASIQRMEYLLQHYSDVDLVPSSLWLQALAYEQLKQPQESLRLCRQLQMAYPQSPEAILAGQWLKRYEH